MYNSNKNYMSSAFTRTLLMLFIAAVAAVDAGIWEIKNIRAFECCIGKE